MTERKNIIQKFLSNFDEKFLLTNYKKGFIIKTVKKSIIN